MVTFLGWTLLHATWQGGIIAALVAVGLGLTRRARSTTRYAIALAGLGLMAVSPVVTTMVTLREFRPPAARAISTMPIASAIRIVSPAPSAAVSAPPATPAAAIVEPWTIERALPWFVGAWLVGVVLLSLRMLAGVLEVRRLGSRGVSDVDERLCVLARDVAGRLGVSAVIRVLQSTQVDVPMVVGWLKPVILVPVALVASASPAQLEMILAHELAHIRRYDTLVNLGQRVVETLLFYHPAAWWLSARVRDERENCSDDLALSVSGVDRTAYAAALLLLEESREVQLASAATDGSLIRRVRRIVRTKPPAVDLGATWVSGVATLAIALMVAAPGGSTAAELPHTESTVGEEVAMALPPARLPTVGRPTASAPVAARLVEIAAQPRPDFSGRWELVADYSTRPAGVGFQSTMLIEQSAGDVVATSDSAGSSIRLGFVIDSVSALAAYLRGPVSVDYRMPGFSFRIDTALATNKVSAQVENVNLVIPIGSGPKRDSMILASVTFTLDRSGMLIVQALVPGDRGEMPKSTFQRFRRVGGKGAPDASERMTPAQVDSMNRLALGIALSIGLSHAGTVDAQSPEVSAEMPYQGIVLIDGERATLTRMRALRQADVRRFAYLIGTVAPTYFTDPEANRGVIAFETGQPRRR